MLKKKSRCVIVGGADIKDYAKAKRNFKKNDYFIFCDCGLKHSEYLGIVPDMIVGDFDSSENPKLNAETIILPREKDDTDTMYAAKKAISMGFEEFLLIGVFGNRLDHTVGNISILLILNSLGKKAVAVDDYGEYEIISKTTAYVPDDYPFFSLLNISGIAKGITIKNAKYPLNNAEITPEYQYGISNEVIKGRQAEITVNDGKLLLMKLTVTN